MITETQPACEAGQEASFTCEVCVLGVVCRRQRRWGPRGYATAIPVDGGRPRPMRRTDIIGYKTDRDSHPGAWVITYDDALTAEPDEVGRLHTSFQRRSGTLRHWNRPGKRIIGRVFR